MYKLVGHKYCRTSHPLSSLQLSSAQMHRSEPTDADETLNNEEQPYKKKRTPLPWIQLLPLYLIQASEPLAAVVIFPFINQFVRETGITKEMNERRVTLLV